MTTATITTCVDCETPVRPTKLRCDKCRPKVLDSLLDRALTTPDSKVIERALILATNNIRDSFEEGAA